MYRFERLGGGWDTPPNPPCSYAPEHARQPDVNRAVIATKQLDWLPVGVRVVKKRRLLKLSINLPETLRFRTATRDDAAEKLLQTNDCAEILSHIINCMNLEQFEECACFIWEHFYIIIANFICEIPFLTAWNTRRSI